MNTQIGKWGNSLAVRIPGTYVRELELQEGMELEVTRVDEWIAAASSQARVHTRGIAGAN